LNGDKKNFPSFTFFIILNRRNMMKKSLFVFLIFFFTSLANAQPVSPDLILPQNQSVNIPCYPHFDWQDIRDATVYHIQIYDIIGIPNLEPEDEDFAIPSEYNYSSPTPLRNGKTYYWRVRAYDGLEWSNWSDFWLFTTADIGSDTPPTENNTPAIFSMSQNYPNPFNPSTVIKFSIPEQAFVKLAVYDVLGREIAFLENEIKSAGIYSVRWNAENIPSGVYIYKITAGNFEKTMKMILLK
jgi:hypothetical protein